MDNQAKLRSFVLSKVSDTALRQLRPWLLFILHK